ncbi:hypothetical protein [Paraburkholderia fungorum]|uniref:Uncharacterized protein n=1 Tax=Paraburkholderia fungorum TaxID=134537 RepID=A0AAW3UZR3_9BURK|nr:hypothetical protein [Paraburkholderia fungorum]MBB4518667.1 hypothetical protein [Paraburkholderia fungorum]MBB6204152.1 hypothetical protein [Paraburkholderia fungorum]
MKRVNSLSRPGAADLQQFVEQTFSLFGKNCFARPTDICQEVRSIYNNVGNPPLLRARALVTLLSAADRYPDLLTLKDEKGCVVSSQIFGFTEFCREFPRLDQAEVAVLFRTVGLVRDVPNALEHTNNSFFLGI